MQLRLMCASFDMKSWQYIPGLHNSLIRTAVAQAGSRCRVEGQAFTNIEYDNHDHDLDNYRM